VDPATRKSILEGKKMPRCREVGYTHGYQLCLKIAGVETVPKKRKKSHFLSVRIYRQGKGGRRNSKGGRNSPVKRPQCEGRLGFKELQTKTIGDQGKNRSTSKRNDGQIQFHDVLDRRE